MAKEEENHKNQNQQTWGTWEELLLASAVKRHGFKNWDTVALEIQSKSALPHLLTTAENCQQKYHDLNRRFNTNNLHRRHHRTEEEAPPRDYQGQQNDRQNNINIDNNNNFVNIPWFEELRQLRVAELKQEVQRYDVSILTLQLKVKKLEEERERSVQEEDSNTETPDLKQERSENRKEHEPDKPVSVSGEESDRENRSVNESNSTGSGGRGGGEDAVGKLEKVDPVMSGSNRKVEEDEEGGGGVGGGEEEELGDSVTQLSSESLISGRKRKGKGKGRERKEVSVTSGDETVAICSGKSEPLVEFLEMIRAHKNGYLYESLLESQEMEVYRDVIRQHMDLEAIQTKLEQGSYSSSELSFFRDLLLLFNNALVFFPKRSAESLTAHELRSLVSNEMRKETQKSDSTVVPENIPPQPKSELERSDSLLTKHKSSIPVIFCRKRSSMSAKLPSSSSLGQKIEQQQQQQSNENKPVNDLKPPTVEQGLLKMKSEEKPVTGARSTRRGKKNLEKGSSSPSKKQNTSPDAKTAVPDKPETPKTEKKKGEALALEKKKSAVDFLKRIKKNSPAESPKKNSRGASNGGGERKKEVSGGKGERGKDRVLRKSGDRKQGKQESSPPKRNIGRPSKKAAEVSKVSGKRGRDSGGKEAAKRPRKRSRR